MPFFILIIIVVYYVYIIESETTGKLYIGQTESPDKRLNDHNRGASPYTKGKGPWKRIFLCEFDTRLESISFEQKLKSWKSSNRVRKWIQNNVSAVG